MPGVKKSIVKTGPGPNPLQRAVQNLFRESPVGITLFGPTQKSSLKYGHEYSGGVSPTIQVVGPHIDERVPNPKFEKLTPFMQEVMTSQIPEPSIAEWAPRGKIAQAAVQLLRKTNPRLWKIGEQLPEQIHVGTVSRGKVAGGTMHGSGNIFLNETLPHGTPRPRRELTGVLAHEFGGHWLPQNRFEVQRTLEKLARKLTPEQWVEIDASLIARGYYPDQMSPLKRLEEFYAHGVWAAPRDELGFLTGETERIYDAIRRVAGK